MTTFPSLWLRRKHHSTSDNCQRIKVTIVIYTLLCFQITFTASNAKLLKQIFTCFFYHITNWKHTYILIILKYRQNFVLHKSNSHLVLDFDWLICILKYKFNSNVKPFISFQCIYNKKHKQIINKTKTHCFTIFLTYILWSIFILIFFKSKCDATLIA